MKIHWSLHRLFLVLLGIGTVASSGVGAAPALRPPIVAREVLFGNPEKTLPQLSPDGKRLAWLAPDRDNVLQVWVKTIGSTDDKAVTADKKRGIRQYYWAQNNRQLLYLQDNDGDENYHVYGVDLATGRVRDYTPASGVRAEITAIDPNYPDAVLISLNQRDKSLFDVYRLDLASGALTLDTQNPGDVTTFFADPKLAVRAAQVTTPDGGTEIRLRESARAPWKSWIKVGFGESLSFVDFTADGQSVTLLSGIGTDKARVVVRNIANNKEKVLAASKEVDAGEVVIQPKTHLVQAVSFAPGRTSWKVVLPSVQADFDRLGKLYNGDFKIVGRDAQDKVWLVAYTADRAPTRYYTWNRSNKQGSLLFVSRPKLEGLTLSKTEPVTFDSRDGLKLNGYLTLPAGLPTSKLPAVLLVHGGPWARDSWGFNPTVQWLANRGYAVLQINYRGSIGYGKQFLNAGNKQWGLKMHDDLVDGVNWLTGTGLADPKKVAIYGGSYGGYAALAGVTFTPDVFACAVDIIGPSNLRTLLSTIPPYWKTVRAEFAQRMGNVDDPQDAELLKNASPLFKADRIIRPLLIGQGANDPRVNKAESEQIVAAIEKNGGQVTYVLYPDEGHGFVRPANRLDFNARAERFLADHLGGRYELMSEKPYPGSTAVVREVVVAPRATVGAP